MLFVDILKNCEEIKDPSFAQKMYAHLCNLVWFNITEDELIDYSWRAAGRFISDVRNSVIDNNDENYLDFYCSGGEGQIDVEIQEFLSQNNIVLFEDFFTIEDYENDNIMTVVEKFKKSHPRIVAYNRDKNINKII